VTARAVAVQGIGSPPLGVATQGFVGALTLVPIMAVRVRPETRRFTTADSVRRVIVTEEVRGVLILAEATPPSAEFRGTVQIPDETRRVTVGGDARLVLIPLGDN
jgi:hypothetical protein